MLARFASLALASTLLLLALAPPAEAARRRQTANHEAIGRLTFASPQSNPIAISPDGDFVFVASTTSNRVDIIPTATNVVTKWVEVGIDPVSVAVLPPNGSGVWNGEVWVANHVSDSISVIDGKGFSSASWGQVIETIQDLDANGVTQLDEPVGIAFSEDGKQAFVALSSRNEIAVIDTILCDSPCSPYEVVHRLPLTAQEPRALAVRGNRLYVAAFESHNQSQVSACEDLAQDPQCTLDINDLAEFAVNPNLPNDVKNIVVDTALPDRDLFVFDISSNPPTLVDVVEGVGTLLYGVAVDASHNVYVTQTDARNTENGLDGLNLDALQNRMFRNRIAVVNCGGASCGPLTQIELDEEVGTAPAPNTQLATPYGIALSQDGSTLVVTAAGSSRVFTVDVTGGTAGEPSSAIAARLAVGAIPRGVAFDSSGATGTAYVLNTVGNSVSVVTVGAGGSLSNGPTIPVGNDPTPEAVRLGRIAFNDADASSEGTFSCGSCHPDGNTDQLLWRIGGACTFGQCSGDDEPRTTMPVRGLRDTLPLHWDGTLGDPFGGSNGRVGGNGSEPPNCTDPHSCFRQLVDESLAGVMCTQPCGSGGALSSTERDNMASFLESVSYPPARSRRMDDTLSVPADGLQIRGVSASALEGFQDFFFDQGGGGSQLGNPHTCADSDAGCHELPLGIATNSETLQGFDAPTMRGMTDRFLQFSLGITAAQDLMLGMNDGTVVNIPGIPFPLNAPPNAFPWDPADGYTETTVFGTAFAVFQIVYAVGPANIFQMFEEASTGHSGATGRQVTLNTRTTDDTGPSPTALEDTEALLAGLEAADARGVVNLRGGGLQSGARATISYLQATDEYQVNAAKLTRSALIAQAQSGALLATLTAHLRENVSEANPQPLIAPVGASSGTGVGDLGDPDLPVLPGDNPMTVEGTNIEAGVVILVDGDVSPGATIDCAQGSGFPTCNNDRFEITLASVPPNGAHVLQVQNPQGLLSNELPFCVGTVGGCL
jgi:YVTN family beta-propeller protein